MKNTNRKPETMRRARATVFVLVMMVGVIIGVGRVSAAGNYEVQWNKNFGGSNWESFYSVVLTTDGGYIAVGHSESTDQDLEGLSANELGAIIVKYDKDGDKEWSKYFGGSNGAHFSSITLAVDGGYVATGCSLSTDQDLAGLNKGYADAIIVKYDKDGNREWNKNFGGSSWDCFRSVATTTDGGYIVAGESHSTDQDMAGLHKGGYIYGVVVKYNIDGEVEWKNSFGGSEMDALERIAATSDGGGVAVGHSYSTDQDLAGLNKGGSDAIIGKYDKDGNEEWNKNFGGAESDAFWGIVESKDGGYVAVGESYSTDQDLTDLNKGDGDDGAAIIVKYDRDGNKEWNKNFGGIGWEYFTGVAATEDGGYVAVGASDSTDGDMAGLLFKGFCDALIVKYDKYGNREWGKYFGGSDNDLFESVVITEDGGYVAVGFSNSIDQDLMGLNKGESDAIIVKYMATPVLTDTTTDVVNAPDTGVGGRLTLLMIVLGEVAFVVVGIAVFFKVRET